ncbi:MAG: S9 family peptidase [Trueperaceae bacterium]
MARRLHSSHLLDLKFVSDPRVAPGGRIVAAVVTDIVPGSEKEPPRYRSSVHVFDSAGGSRRVADPPYSDSRPRFSPDGRYLAFLRREDKETPAQLAIVDLSPLEPGAIGRSPAMDPPPEPSLEPPLEPRQLSDSPGGVDAFEWHPDSQRLAFLARDDGPVTGTPPSRTIERLRHKVDGKGYLPKGPRRVRVVELTASEPGSAVSGVAGPNGAPGSVPAGESGTLVTDRDLNFEELAWAGDGRYLLLSAAADNAEWDEYRRRLWRLETETGELVPLLGPARLSGLSPSPDGRSVAFLAPAHDDNVAGPTAVWLTDVAGGRPWRASADDELSPSLGGDSRLGDQPNTPQWLGDGGLLVNLNRRGSSNLAVLEPEQVGLRPLAENAAAVSCFHHADGAVAFVRESSSEPGELFFGPVGGPARALTTLNGDLSERVRFRPATGPHTPAESGDAAYWRIDPEVPRDDRAIVLQVHGGPHTNVGNCFYFEFQLLAAHGYTVLYGNPRGSSSYGHSFATSILGAYGSIDADDVLAFADHALARHEAPDAPVHLTGGSYGGFMTNWLVAHTDRFRSAVTQRSICNFASFYGTSDIGYDFSERELGGNPWEDFERLWLQSPLRLVHRVATPLLIIHAEGDQRCPVEQAQQLFVGLRRAGNVDTRLLLFPEEGHELSRSGRPDRRVLRLDAIVDWFQTHA